MTLAVALEEQSSAPARSLGQSVLTWERAERTTSGNVVSIQGRGGQIEYVEKPPGNDSESSSRPL